MSLPNCLTHRKLVFGDVEQIAAVKAIEQEQANKEEQEALIASGVLKKFNVEVIIESSKAYTIIAESEAAAKNEAKEMFFDEIDLELESWVWVRDA